MTKPSIDRRREVSFIPDCVRRQQLLQPNAVSSRRRHITLAVTAVVAGVVGGLGVLREEEPRLSVPTLDELDRQFEKRGGVYVCDRWTSSDDCRGSLKVFGSSSDPDEPDAGDFLNTEITSPLD